MIVTIIPHSSVPPPPSFGGPPVGPSYKAGTHFLCFMLRYSCFLSSAVVVLWNFNTLQEFVAPSGAAASASGPQTSDKSPSKQLVWKSGMGALIKFNPDFVNKTVSLVGKRLAIDGDNVFGALLTRKDACLVIGEPPDHQEVHHWCARKYACLY